MATTNKREHKHPCLNLLPGKNKKVLKNEIKTNKNQKAIMYKVSVSQRNEQVPATIVEPKSLHSFFF